MIRRTFFLHVKDGTAKENVKEAERVILAAPKEAVGIKRVLFGPNIRSNGPWTHLMEMEFPDELAITAYRAHPYHVGPINKWFGTASPVCLHDKAEVVNYEPFAEGVRIPDKRHLIRCPMLIEVIKGTPVEKVAEYEEAVLKMPKESRGIGNFSLGRVLPHLPHTSGWTHNLIFEFADQAALDLHNVDKYHKEGITPYYRAGNQRRVVEKVLYGTFEVERSMIE